MNNDQYSNMMVAFATLGAKIEKLEKLLQPYAVEFKVDSNIEKSAPAESFSRFPEPITYITYTGS